MPDDYTCAVCGRQEAGRPGWPTPTLCLACGRKRDLTEPKPCPFCGIQGARWGVKENDSSKFWISCAVCDAQGPKADLQDLAMWEWNRRRMPNDQAHR